VARAAEERTRLRPRVERSEQRALGSRALRREEAEVSREGGAVPVDRVADDQALLDLHRIRSDELDPAARRLDSLEGRPCERSSGRPVDGGVAIVRDDPRQLDLEVGKGSEDLPPELADRGPASERSDREEVLDGVGMRVRRDLVRIARREGRQHALGDLRGGA
jgi:hypothetical protein